MNKLKKVELNQTLIAGESYYKIANVDAMRPFFMSIVSDSNHWMFISSNGGLTAGRKNAENALFPYYTDDKITELKESTGNKSVFLVDNDGESNIWEPFSDKYTHLYNISRNLYKNVYGNKIIFEEVNHNLDLIFQYQWNSSNKFGFVRKSKLINKGKTSLDIKILDGVQNIIPHGVGVDLQNAYSNLVDAYKRSELLPQVGLGIFALSSIIVDRAEPSEALKANIVWSLGLDNPTYLLSTLQEEVFKRGEKIQQEEDVKAEKGAYLVAASITLESQLEKEWFIVANVNQNASSIAEISHRIKNDKDLKDQIVQDVNEGTKNLIKLASAADGMQLTADKRRNTRHYANTLFNIMRGGIFDDNYSLEKWDFSNYLRNANKQVYIEQEEQLKELPESFILSELKKIINNSQDKNFIRLASEYMPLKFSRRHGDPSRPWNKFSINTKNEIDGSKVLDYEGNWRDIFQNWEALAHAYPEFIESMIFKFLNATTFDGYNPYRVTKSGFDWEAIEENDPWSYIGYWGDHQIIYLLKFLEFIQNHYPNKLTTYFNKNVFVYAHVPYKIKSYADILKNAKDTIDFDGELDAKIRLKRSQEGADGVLLRNNKNFIHKVNFIEKILASVLAKVSNFIPEGGIWLNTQRPEWNDANNALVGNGVSMVTLYYLRRFLHFFKELVPTTELDKVEISEELMNFFNSVVDTLDSYQETIPWNITDKCRKLILDGLGQAGSDYRFHIYEKSFSGKTKALAVKDLERFIDLSLRYLDQSIKANKRDDNLYHAYNLMTVEDGNEISISYLSEMLEGQVAVLSSGYLSSSESLELLDSLKQSKLFREDQYSYILYPNKELPRFTEKNNIPEKSVLSSNLLTKLIDDGNMSIIEKDINDIYHFNSNFNNANDLKRTLNELTQPEYARLVKTDMQLVLQIFEEVFNHKAFTGRSGTFFGYEGLGSIYWHMVSKLVLAVQECCLKAIHDNESDTIIGRLLEHYYEIDEGVGVHKSPTLYGAFPTDPYSHTPAGKGAQQPGMTGQVKEDILSRFGELGIYAKNGKLYFNPCLLRKEELLKDEKDFKFIDVTGSPSEVKLSKNELAFTYCQVPIIYKVANKNTIKSIFSDGRTEETAKNFLDCTISEKIFKRTNEVLCIEVHSNNIIR